VQNNKLNNNKHSEKHRDGLPESKWLSKLVAQISTKLTNTVTEQNN